MSDLDKITVSVQADDGWKTVAVISKSSVRWLLARELPPELQSIFRLELEAALVAGGIRISRSEREPFSQVIADAHSRADGVPADLVQVVGELGDRARSEQGAA